MYVDNRVKTRDFALDCYFEAVTLDMREGLLQWLDRNTQGALTFDDRPYVYYDVRPAKRIEIRQYNHRTNGETLYSGTFTITFRCYDPFGKLYMPSFVSSASPAILAETGVLYTDMILPTPSPSDIGFLVYNAGTERAPLIIRLAGDVGVDGLSIENETTGQACKIIGLKEAEIPPGAYLEINSETGQVWLVNGIGRELAFHYHDMGYLHAAPCKPFVRSLTVMHTAGERLITSDSEFTPEMAGQYVFLSGAWMEIRAVNDVSHAQLRNVAVVSEITDTPVATMNKIWLRGDNVSLTRIEVE